MTIESCLAFCTPGGFQFAGVEFARECYCDNVIESPGAPIDDSTCNMACTGDASEICGGAGAVNVFHNTAATTTSPPVPTSTATIKQTAGSFQYKGCFDDGVNGAPRSLATQLSVSGGVTAESCTAACKAAGFTLAGLEFGQECWCDKYMSLAIPAPDSDCNMVCNADNSELCGAGNRLAVYQDTSATLDVQQCLSAAQLHSSVFHYSLLAVPTSGSGSSFVVGTFELTAQAGQPSFFELSVRSWFISLIRHCRIN
ncbi:WSC-domain-containing protein [Agrocybe pediades]|nr:WSC-domain-containing protein [Agrocybe pediades]